jgi:hypothetical protein
VLHQNKNGIRTISQPVAKKRIFCVRDMERFGFRGTAAEAPFEETAVSALRELSTSGGKDMEFCGRTIAETRGGLRSRTYSVLRTYQELRAKNTSMPEQPRRTAGPVNAGKLADSLMDVTSKSPDH